MNNTDQVDQDWNSLLEMNAVFSACRRYRYALMRTWEPSKPTCLFVGLNPSTADETENDHTINRCLSYARNWGYGRMFMGNLFAFASTDPAGMKKAIDPIGPENDAWLMKLSATSDLTVGVWGNHGAFMGRSTQVRGILGDLYCLRINKSGEPAHPIYQLGTLLPQTFPNIPA